MLTVCLWHIQSYHLCCDKGVSLHEGKVSSVEMIFVCSIASICCTTDVTFVDAESVFESMTAFSWETKQSLAFT